MSNHFTNNEGTSSGDRQRENQPRNYNQSNDFVRSSRGSTTIDHSNNPVMHQLTNTNWMNPEIYRNLDTSHLSGESFQENQSLETGRQYIGRRMQDLMTPQEGRTAFDQRTAYVIAMSELEKNDLQKFFEYMQETAQSLSDGSDSKDIIEHMLSSVSPHHDTLDPTTNQNNDSGNNQDNDGVRAQMNDIAADYGYRDYSKCTKEQWKYLRDTVTVTSASHPNYDQCMEIAGLCRVILEEYGEAYGSRSNVGGRLDHRFSLPWGRPDDACARIIPLIKELNTFRVPIINAVNAIKAAYSIEESDNSYGTRQE